MDIIIISYCSMNTEKCSLVLLVVLLVVFGGDFTCRVSVLVVSLVVLCRFGCVIGSN